MSSSQKRPLPIATSTHDVDTKPHKSSLSLHPIAFALLGVRHVLHSWLDDISAVHLLHVCHSMQEVVYGYGVRRYVRWPLSVEREADFSRLGMMSRSLVLENVEVISLEVPLTGLHPTVKRLGIICAIGVESLASLPPGLKKLNLWNLIGPIGQNVLPSSLKELTFGWKFNQPIARDVLPLSLEQLTFGSKFNQPIDRGVLPSCLKQLTFGHDFNQPIAHDVLPLSLQQLKCRKFNQRINCNVLPSSLKQLTFGRMFNQHIDCVALHSSLQKLKLVNYKIVLSPLHL